MNTENKWVSEGVIERWKDSGWQIHRRNRTSGKSRGGISCRGLSEYVAKTMCNDANLGAGCFYYRVVSPDGEVFSLPLERYEIQLGKFLAALKLVEIREDDGRAVWEHFQGIIDDFDQSLHSPHLSPIPTLSPA